MITKKHFIVTGCIALISCGGDDSSEVIVNPVEPDATLRIQFNPLAGQLPLPSDLLFSGTQDGTIEPPAETASKGAGEATDLSDPGSSLGGVDGWSMQMPMQVTIDLIDGAELDTSSVSGSSVLMVETDCGLGLTGCTTFSSLTYGVDYVAIASASSVTVVPVQPLKAKTNYIIAFTNDLLDTEGVAVKPSEFYELMTRSDVAIEGALSALQSAVNGYEGIVSSATGINPDDMIFTSSWTTSSTLDVAVAAFGVTQSSFSPQVSNITAHPAVNTANVGGTGDANIYLGSITLPYYSAVPTDSNPFAPLTDRWQALCDNGVLLSTLTTEQLSALTPGANNDSCAALGLADYGLDTERYMTQYNPVPDITAINNLEVLITVPTTGSNWPVVIFQHGITRLKEDALAVADSFARAGFATVAIDLPLHGGRGFNNGTDLQINATTDTTSGITGDVTHYMNLGYLLTGRDNLRQSYVDIAGLRLGVASGFSCADGVTICDNGFDTASVHFVGLSLGGITGVGFNSVATAAGLPSSSATYVAASGGIVPLLFDSQSFGGLVSGTVLAGAGITDPDSQEAAETLSAFAFAAQTILDGADPNNLAETASLISPTFLIQVNGDSVIPNSTSFGGLTFGGTEALATRLDLSQLMQGDAAEAEGFVKFTEGGHSTLLSPEVSAAATVEMQSLIANFLENSEISLGASSVGLVE